jgi:hypothetical protein
MATAVNPKWIVVSHRDHLMNAVGTSSVAIHTVGEEAVEGFLNIHSDRARAMVIGRVKQ